MTGTSLTAFTVTVNDGTSNSDPFVFQIQVGDANDPPVITAQVPLSTNEEQPITIQLSNLTVTDPDNVYPSGFSLLVSEGSNFLVTGTTITPVMNFAGLLTIPVRVNDGVNNSATFDLKISVNPINDAPVFDAISNQVVSENSGEKIISINNITSGPGESDQQITFVASSANASVIPNPAIAYVPGSSTATLTFKPAANASGVVEITVMAIDNGPAGGTHQNSFSSSFQIDVKEINSAPTLNAIPNAEVVEDAPETILPLAGISAGAGESQSLTIEVTSDKPELFEMLNVLYVSPQSAGSLQIKPRANANGSATVTVKVTDTGSAVAPSVNTVSRTFVFKVTPVNDPPVFVSKPVSLAALNEPYVYDIDITDVETNALPFTIMSKPTWLTLVPLSAGKARLTGTPPTGTAGNFTVRIQVNDSGNIVEQQFTLLVNTRPVIKPINLSVEEDGLLTFQSNFFSQAFTDENQHAMSAILITQKPGAGTVFLGDREVRNNDTISVASISLMAFKPNKDYSGPDAFYWKASDGYHFTTAAVAAQITVNPVNDPPVVDLVKDTLVYEVNGESSWLAELVEITDADNDSLKEVEIAFGADRFEFEFDRLEFVNTANIKGTYDFQNGRLLLTGYAPLDGYQQAIRSIRYTHLNTLDPDLSMKSVSIRVNDGNLWSEEKNLSIDLQYTFIELEIPSGFTPNGDQANDVWVITRPGGLEKLGNAEVSVFNKRGIQVFHAEGFDLAWDGTYKGQQLPADTYFYTIDLKLRNKKTYKGVVIILR